MIDWLLNLGTTEQWAFGLVAFLVFGVVVQWIGQRINHSLSVLREKGSRRTIASDRLRAAFVQALAQLELGRRHGSTHEAPDIDGFLNASLLNHAAAIDEFRPFVDSGNIRAYQLAWDEYCEAAKGGLFIASHFNSTDPWAVIEGKIHAVLRFANAS